MREKKRGARTTRGTWKNRERCLWWHHSSARARNCGCLTCQVRKRKRPVLHFVGLVLACQASSLFSLRAASSRIRIRAGFVSCVPLHFQNPPRPGDVDYSGVPVGGYDRCDAPCNHQPNRNPTIFRPVLLLLQKKDEEHPNTPHTLRAAKLQRYLRLHLHNEVLPASGIHGSYGGCAVEPLGRARGKRNTIERTPKCTAT